MEIKYQVFVSSTYKDLSEERQEVMQALLELDCIPVGMELFPAADDDQWTLIKRLIDDCDYYVLIVGGRYGSMNIDGVSYTQMEYEYAISKDVPIIAFLHKNPGKIPVDKSETDPLLLKKLDSFKELAQKKMCRYWENAIDLGSQVSRSLVRLIKDKPRHGWVKATALPSEETTKELLDLKNEVERLKGELEKTTTKAPEGIEELSQGDDKVIIKYSLKDGWSVYGKDEFGFGEVWASWNEIFTVISPLMIDESAERPLVVQLNNLITKKIKEQPHQDRSTKSGLNSLLDTGISEESFHTVIVQLKALGLIKKSTKKRSLKDTDIYWTLTPYGESVMTRLIAIKK
jgi:hypothetical protein